MAQVDDIIGQIPLAFSFARLGDSVMQTYGCDAHLYERESDHGVALVRLCNDSISALDIIGHCRIAQSTRKKFIAVFFVPPRNVIESVEFFSTEW